MATTVKRTNNTKLIRLNKKKIAIWSTVAVLLITGISLTLYFTLRTTGYPFPSELTQTTGTELAEIALSGEHGHWEDTDDNPDTPDEMVDGELWGIYIGSTNSDEGCPHCHEAIYGTQDIKDKSTMDGQFTLYLENDAEIPWYAIEGDSIEDAKNQGMDFFRALDGQDTTAINNGDINATGLTGPILILPGTDEELNTFGRTNSAEGAKANYSVSINLSTSEIVGGETIVAEDGTESNAQFGIPGFVWMYGPTPLAMSIGFTEADKDPETGEETGVYPQSAEYFVEAEALITDWFIAK